MKLALVLLLCASPLTAQQSWVTELGGGAGVNLFARGPWIAPSWQHHVVGRMALSVGLSACYEYLIEPWNHQTNAGRASDVWQRFVGSAGLELLLHLVRR